MSEDIPFDRRRKFISSQANHSRRYGKNTHSINLDKVLGPNGLTTTFYKRFGTLSNQSRQIM
jgi:hypothetical protein